MSANQVAPSATYQSAERVLALLAAGSAATPGRTRWRTGKVLLSYGVLPQPRRLERYTAATVTSPEALARQLAAIRRDGYAKAVAELEDGLVAVAAPVFDPAGTCVAALSISGRSTG